MKPTFSKGRGKEIYLPGDPRRKEFEKEWRLAGLNLEEMESQPIAVENGEGAKVSNAVVYIFLDALASLKGRVSHFFFILS